MTIEKVRPRCFLDVDIDGQNVGRVVIELFSDICPLTCENFRALCTGEKGVGKTTNKPLHYKGVPFHRIVKNFIIQSGDFVAGNGTGGESIYGGTFKDESFEIKHDKPFLLSMANKGKDTNGSQFFITTQPAPHLDGKHTVFGHVISGQQVVLEIESQKTGTNSRPVKDVLIANCGELVLKAKPKSRKTRSASESSSSTDSEGEKSKSRKKKKKRRHEKRSKKERKEKISSKVESASKHEISFDCSVDPKEIPEVPANNFLMRRSPAKDGNRPFNRAPGRPGGYVFSRKPAVSRSGRKIKGRGLMRYRTPSSSGSRSGSETPPHWRQAQARVVPLDQVISRIGGREGSRSASPEEQTEKDSRQKPDAVPLKQRLGPFRRTAADGSDNDEEEEEEPLNIKVVQSDVRRGRETRQRRASPIKWRNDRSLDYRGRRHSGSDEESNTSPESKSRNSPIRSMVVKADADRRRNEDKDRRDRRSPIKRDRQRTPDRRPHRSDDRVDRSARNQNPERNSRRERPQRDAANNLTARPRHESEKDSRRHNKESDSKRPAKKDDADRGNARKSPVSRRRHSSSSGSDGDKRKRKRKESQVSDKESRTISRRHRSNDGSASSKKNEVSVIRSQETEGHEFENKERKRSYSQERTASDECQTPSNELNREGEKAMAVVSSLKSTLAAYAGDISPSSESEREEVKRSLPSETHGPNDVAELAFNSYNKDSVLPENMGESSQGSYPDQSNNIDATFDAVEAMNKNVCSVLSEEPKANETEDSRSMPVTDMDVDNVSSSQQEVYNTTNDSDRDVAAERSSASTSFVGIINQREAVAETSQQEPVEAPKSNSRKKSESPCSMMETDDAIKDVVPSGDSPKQNPEPMEVDEAIPKEEASALPESSSFVSESEPFVSSSVGNDKIESEMSRNTDSEQQPSQSYNYTCMDIPLDVIPLPEESEPYISGQKAVPEDKVEGIPIPSERKRTSSDSSARSPSPEKVDKPSDSEKSDSCAPKRKDRSRSDSSSSVDRKSLPMEESSGDESNHQVKESQRTHAHDNEDSDVEKPHSSSQRPSNSNAERKSASQKQPASSIHMTMIPSVLRHSRVAKSQVGSHDRDLSPKASSDLPAESSQAGKSGSDSDQPSDSKTRSPVSTPVEKPGSSAGDRTLVKKGRVSSSRSSSRSSTERQSKLKSGARSHSSPERRMSPVRRKSKSPVVKRDARARRVSGSPSPERKSRSPVVRRSRSPVRARRRLSPERRKTSPTPSPPRRGYRKSRSPVKNKSPASRRSKSSSRSPSARRSHSRTRSPVRRRYSRSPERRYYRRSWSRPYDSRSRFPRYPRPRNRSPDRSYQRYGRDRDRLGHRGRAGVGHSTSRSRSRSRSEIERRRRKRRADRSSSSTSSSRSSSSSSGKKKQPKKKAAKKRRSSSSSSTSSSRSGSSS